jgi:hypothetical protein
MPLATAAAISRERHGDAFHVRVRLMNHPPSQGLDGTGTSDPGEVIADFITHQLETDLTDAFAGNDVFILK